MIFQIVRLLEMLENLNSKIFKTKNGRLIMLSKCIECGFKKSSLWKNKKQKGYWVTSESKCC